LAMTLMVMRMPSVRASCVRAQCTASTNRWPSFPGVLEIERNQARWRMRLIEGENSFNVNLSPVRQEQQLVDGFAGRGCYSARGPDADRRGKALIYLALEGSHFRAYSQMARPIDLMMPNV
jgi:hypothetical protein